MSHPERSRGLGTWLLSLWGLGLPLLCLSALALAHLAGWRAHTSLLSGTHPGSSAALAQGLVYVCAWFACLTVAPIAFGSVVLDHVLGRIAAGRGQNRPAEVPSESGCGLGRGHPGEAESA